MGIFVHFQLVTVAVANRNYFFPVSFMPQICENTNFNWLAKSVRILYLSWLPIKILIQEMRRCKLSAQEKNAISIMT